MDFYLYYNIQPDGTVHSGNRESNQHRYIISATADWKWWRGGDGMEGGEAELVEAGSS